MSKLDLNNNEKGELISNSSDLIKYLKTNCVDRSPKYAQVVATLIFYGKTYED